MSDSCRITPPSSPPSTSSQRVPVAAPTFRPAAPGARLLQRPPDLGQLARVPLRDRHRRPQRHPRLRRPRRHRPPPRPAGLSVLDGDVAFGYWHIIPAVRHHQRINRHQLVGHVAAPWLHVHFAERRAGVYRDPLRPGALTPWQDTTKPRVTRIVFSRNGRVLSPTSIFGPVDVIAEAHQLPARKVPPPWDGLPVTPARIRWRVRRGEHTVRRLAHPDRPQQDTAPTHRLPTDLRPRHPPKPPRQTRPLPLLPRPHLEHHPPPRRPLPPRGRSHRPQRQPGPTPPAIHDHKRALSPARLGRSVGVASRRRPHRLPRSDAADGLRPRRQWSPRSSRGTP